MTLFHLVLLCLRCCQYFFNYTYTILKNHEQSFFCLQKIMGYLQPVSSDVSFSYSDGKLTEYLLQINRRLKTSNIYLKAIMSLACKVPTSQRSFIFEQNFSECTSILELGAGLGCLTQFLSSKSKNVVSVEGSYSRCLCISERKTKNRPIIINDNINSLELDATFDYVILNGVLEYSPAFSNSEDPFSELIEKATGFLNHKGVLIIAIENQIGLRYFTNSPEDHSGKMYHSVNLF